MIQRCSPCQCPTAGERASSSTKPSGLQPRKHEEGGTFPPGRSSRFISVQRPPTRSDRCPCGCRSCPRRWHFCSGVAEPALRMVCDGGLGQQGWMAGRGQECPRRRPFVLPENRARRSNKSRSSRAGRWASRSVSVCRRSREQWHRPDRAQVKVPALAELRDGGEKGVGRCAWTSPTPPGVRRKSARWLAGGARGHD